MQNLFKVVQSVWSCDCLTALFWEQRPCLNKLYNFPQPIAREKKNTRHALRRRRRFFPPHPQNPVWPRLPPTTMANQSLIQHHAMLTRSPRLWGGSGAAVPARRKRETSLLRGSREANGQPTRKAKTAGQARPKRDQTGDPVAASRRVTGGGDGWSGTTVTGTTCVMNVTLIGRKSCCVWSLHVCDRTERKKKKKYKWLNGKLTNVRVAGDSWVVWKSFRRIQVWPCATER